MRLFIQSTFLVIKNLIPQNRGIDLAVPHKNILSHLHFIKASTFCQGVLLNYIIYKVKSCNAHKTNFARSTTQDKKISEKNKPQGRLSLGLGAGNQNRTDDLVITNDVLYRLSHTSIFFLRPCNYNR